MIKSKKIMSSPLPLLYNFPFVLNEEEFNELENEKRNPQKRRKRLLILLSIRDGKICNKCGKDVRFSWNVSKEVEILNKHDDIASIRSSVPPCIGKGMPRRILSSSVIYCRGCNAKVGEFFKEKFKELRYNLCK